MFKKNRLLLYLFITFFTFQVAHGQWNPNPTVNTPISTGSTKHVFKPFITGDDNGGYYITWYQVNDGTYGMDIYLQHVDANGNPLWAKNGIVVCNADLNQLFPRVLSDGNGGVYVAWHDCRTSFSNFDIYAQHYSADGTPLWTANGLQVTNQSFSNEYDVQLVSDGTGGIIICWWKAPSGGQLQADVFAQRINANGDMLWPANGVAVCTAPNRQNIARMVSDGNGGVIIAWDDFRNNPNVPDVYAQRLDGNGSALWAPNGIPICTLPYDQTDVRLVSDAQGGAIISWTDFRASSFNNNVLDIYAQRISPTGAALWSANGIPLCASSANQQAQIIVGDGMGGAIISWYEKRTPTGGIYCQRITGGGERMWSADGVLVCSVLKNFSGGHMVKDGQNGAFIAWQDERNGPEKDIYAQHILANGSTGWTENGVPVCNAAGTQMMLIGGYLDTGEMTATSDGSAVLVWEDQRSGAVDLYATKLMVKPPIPLIVNVNDKCTSSPTTTGKLVNPPSLATIAVKQDGVSLNYNPADSSFQYFIAGATPAGGHTITVEYSNAYGSSQKDTIYIASPGATPSITIQTNATSICTGATANFTAAISEAGTSPSYQWQLNGDDVGSNTATWSSTTLQNGDIVSCILAVDPSLTCATTTTAVSNSLEMIVNTADPPSLAIDASGNTICPGTMVQFTATALNSGASPVYQWKLNGINTGDNSPVYPANNLASNDEVYCIITPGSGSCSNAPVSSNTITMTVHPVPSVTVSPSDTVIMRNSKVQITAVIQGSFDTWSWYPAAGLSNPSSLSTFTNPVTENTDYLFSVLTAEGCQVQDTSSIKILNGLYLPNAFTPNDDGLNDIFRIPPYTLQKLKRFSVYNRWGNLVFTTSDAGTGWNGHVNDVKCDAGTYVYVIEGFDGVKNILFKGTVTLVR